MVISETRKAVREQIHEIKVWQWITIGLVALCMLMFCFFYAHWFSYELGAKHLEVELFYPIVSSALLLPFVLGIWIVTIQKRKNPFLAILISILYIGATLCILGGFNGGCPMCDYPPDRIYQRLRTLFYGKPLIETW